MYAAEHRLNALFVSGLEGNADDYGSFLQKLTPHLRDYLRKRIPQLSDEVEDLGHT